MPSLCFSEGSTIYPSLFSYHLSSQAVCTHLLKSLVSCWPRSCSFGSTVRSGSVWALSPADWVGTQSTTYWFLALGRPGPLVLHIAAAGLTFSPMICFLSLKGEATSPSGRDPHWLPAPWPQVFGFFSGWFLRGAKGRHPTWVLGGHFCPGLLSFHGQGGSLPPRILPTKWLRSEARTGHRELGDSRVEGREGGLRRGGMGRSGRSATLQASPALLPCPSH